MKKHMLGMVVCAMALLAVSGAMAQGGAGDVLVNVPFAFVAGSHQLPAGRYTVTRTANGFLRMYGAHGSNQSVFLGVHNVESTKANSPKLIFHRYGDSYFLTQVWSTGWGRELPKTKWEKELASRLSTRPGPEVAEVRAAH